MRSEHERNRLRNGWQEELGAKLLGPDSNLTSGSEVLLDGPDAFDEFQAAYRERVKVLSDQAQVYRDRAEALRKA